MNYKKGYKVTLPLRRYERDFTKAREESEEKEETAESRQEQPLHTDITGTPGLTPLRRETGEEDTGGGAPQSMMKDEKHGSGAASPAKPAAIVRRIFRKQVRKGPPPAGSRGSGRTG